MKTPHDKYMNDSHFRYLVDMMVSHIMQAQFTPSEMREAALMASIKYESMNFRNSPLVIRKAEEAFAVLEEITRKH